MDSGQVEGSAPFSHELRPTILPLGLLPAWNIASGGSKGPRADKVKARRDGRLPAAWNGSVSRGSRRLHNATKHAQGSAPRLT